MSRHDSAEPELFRLPIELYARCVLQTQFFEYFGLGICVRIIHVVNTGCEYSARQAPPLYPNRMI